MQKREITEKLLLWGLNMFIDVNEFFNESGDSEMIQAAVDKAALTGESVVIPKFNKRTGEAVWNIDKVVVLHDETVLLLNNCHIRQADGAICNIFTNDNARTDKATDKSARQHDIIIKGIGKAILDGGIHNGLYEANGVSRSTSKYPDRMADENCMIFMQNIEHLTIENITCKNPRYWAIALYAAVDSRVSDIHLMSESNVPNQDGVDLFKGCHNVVIERITGCIGDNAIALLATKDPIYQDMGDNPEDSDIYNIIIRDIMVYGVCGCSLIRLLNHDGLKIYNVNLDNVIETSPWSWDDAPVAQNPDLVMFLDDDGNVKPYEKLIPGKDGYRCEAAIIIGESYWYNYSKAQRGDTYGISVSNVVTHSRFGLFLNNTLRDSSFDHIRMFGNGYMAAYFGEGTFENVTFSNISFDKETHPLKDDEHIRIEWNHTSTDGFSAFYFNGSNVEGIRFTDVDCARGMEAVFGGHGNGEIGYRNIKHGFPKVSNMKGIRATQI